MSTKEVTQLANNEFAQVELARKQGNVYLDNAATTQTSTTATTSVHNWYTSVHGSVHRGFYTSGEQSTADYEQARRQVQTFVRAEQTKEIIFTKSCTEALNICILGWGTHNLTKSSVVALSIASHHSAITPWLQLQKTIGFTIEWITLDNTGQFNIEQFTNICKTSNIAAVCTPSISNVLGIQNDSKRITGIAHKHGAISIIDAAQSVAHERINVQSIDCDFLTFSGHKLFAPTGIGILYGKQELLEQIPPVLTGGMMVGEVTKNTFTYADVPQKFEAGTPSIAQAIALGNVCNLLTTVNFGDIHGYESELLQYAVTQLQTIDSISILYNEQLHIGCISFYSTKVHAHDIADILASNNIAVRAGQHCAQPLHEHLGTIATVRISVALYNTKSDIDALVQTIQDFFNKL